MPESPSRTGFGQLCSPGHAKAGTGHKAVKTRPKRHRVGRKSQPGDWTDEDFDVKELAGLLEPAVPELPRRTLTLQAAGQALRDAGYQVDNAIEVRGQRNGVCEFTLTRLTAPALGDGALVAEHLRQVFVLGGFDVPQQHFLVGTDDGDLIHLAFLIWFADRR